jgi:long-subunit fatty acid transport protein
MAVWIGNQMKEDLHRKFFILMGAALLWILAIPAHATFIEQMAIDARAIALANTVTADPPGILAIHYNPAGLSLLPEGKYVTTGATLALLTITSNYDADPDFEGFFGGYNEDPLANSKGKTSSGHMYIPIMNRGGNFLVSPVLGLSYRPPQSRWSFAIGNYTPFAVGFAHDDKDDPVRFGARRAYAQHFVYMAPSVSYKLTKDLSAGLTVGVGQTALGVSVDMRSPNDLVALTRVLGDATQDLHIPILSELTFPPPWFGGGIGPYDQVASLEMTTRDDFSPNYNVGLLYEPLKWISLGLVYQSEIKVQLTGRYRFDYSEEFQKTIDWLGSSPTLLMLSGMLNMPYTAVPYQSGTVYSDYKFPQRAQMGVKLKPLNRVSLLADLHWADWSSLKEDRFVFDQDIQLFQLVKVLGYTGGNRELVLRRDFKDTWHWSLGLELQVVDWLSLMMGYERRPTSVSMAHFDNIYSLPDMDNYGAGLSLKLKNGTQLDLSGAYLVNKKIVIPNNTSDLMNSTDPFAPVYNPYAGLHYTQKTETWLASFKVTMPFEVMAEMVEHTLSLLNPLNWRKK